MRDEYTVFRTESGRLGRVVGLRGVAHGVQHAVPAMEDRAHVLVVDDEPGPRESLKIILKPEYRVTTTDRGSTALELLQSGDFDAVLLDLTMPADLSGMETQRAIRAAGIDVEIIVITGQGALDSAVESMRLGARDYIAKPYEAHDIRAAVRSALAARSAQRRASRMREQLLENLSHEFRTPLHAISGYSEILSDETNQLLSAEQRNALGRIQLNSQRLLSYLEGLFFLAELDRGEPLPGATEFDVRPWLESLLQPILREAAEKGVTVTLLCDPELSGIADRHTLGRLMSALLYATSDQPSGGAVLVAADRSERAGLRLCITPGPGVAGPEVDRHTTSLRDLPFSDPLAREVVTRAAARLDASIVTEMDGASILRIHIQLPEAPRRKRGDESPAERRAGALAAPAR